MLRDGVAPALHSWSGPEALLNARMHGDARVVEHRASSASKPQIIQLHGYEECWIDGIQLRWDGSVLMAHRTPGASTHLFTAQLEHALLVGNSLPRLRDEMNGSLLGTDPMALLDIVHFGRVLPPFTLHEGITSLDVGEAIVARTQSGHVAASLHRRQRLTEALSQHLRDTEDDTSGLRPALPRVGPFRWTESELAPVCSLVTGLPVGDLGELEFLATLMDGDRPVADEILFWAARDASPAPAIAIGRGTVTCLWEPHRAALMQASHTLLAHREAWSARRAELFANLQDAVARETLPGITIDALFHATAVVPDRLARLLRIAASCGATPEYVDSIQAAALVLRRGRVALRAPRRLPLENWGARLVDHMARADLQQRPGCVREFFPTGALQSRMYRRALEGPLGPGLLQRLAGILTAQFLEEQVLHREDLLLNQ